MAVCYATKAFVLSFSKGLAVELEGTGVSVTALSPGLTESSFEQRSGAVDTLLYWLLPQTTAKAVAKAGYRAMMRGPPRRDPRPLDEDAGARRRAPAAGHCPGGEPLACRPPHHGEQAALGEIAQTLLELVEERPEAAALLRGRTFARTLH